MLNSLDRKLPDLFLVRGRPIQENPVNCQGEPSSQWVFNFGARRNGVQGVAGSNPAVPIGLTRRTVGNAAGGASCFNKRWCRLWCCFANHLTHIRVSRRRHQPDASGASRIFFGSLITANNGRCGAGCSCHSPLLPSGSTGGYNSALFTVAFLREGSRIQFRELRARGSIDVTKQQGAA